MGNEHWVETTLREVVRNKKGKKPKILSEKPFKNSLPYIDIEAFETGKIKQYADMESSSHCDNSDVLVVWDGARFGLAGYNQKGAIGSTLACLTPIEIEPLYLLKFIQRNYQIIQQKPKGMATPHVDPDVFWNLEFPLPPLNEQKRIVEKLDCLLPKVRQSRERLENIPAILKKFKISILMTAFSEETRFERLEDVAELRLGKMLDQHKNKGNFQPYLRNLNVRWFGFDLNDLFEMKFSSDEEDRYNIVKGDLVVCEGGEPGRCAVWQSDKPIKYQKALHRIRSKKGLSVEYVMYYLHFLAQTGELEQCFTGTE
jgi:type I restriction enzyme S subunit